VKQVEPELIKEPHQKQLELGGKNILSWTVIMVNLGIIHLDRRISWKP
jgi:hypothetical protein